jgi:hypothetical protein
MLGRDDHGFVDIKAIALIAAFAADQSWLLPGPVVGSFTFPLHFPALPSALRSAVENGEVPVAREQRKLAAILAADVIGYSRLMGGETRAARWRFLSAVG